MKSKYPTICTYKTRQCNNTVEYFDCLATSYCSQARDILDIDCENVLWWVLLFIGKVIVCLVMA